jgi:dTDP-4-dehydrorhamnose reductase
VRILVTGHTGLLGTELMPVLQAEHDVSGCSLPERDITDPQAVRHAVEEARPDLVIHAAAYTAVDECERQPDLAFRVNALGTRNVALAAQATGARIAYISTDYVFDGTKGSPYIEFDDTHPLGVYGRSKWAGEQFVRYLGPPYYIIRSAWLFGAGGACFPETILRLIREKGKVEVVTDQVGNPTWARDLAVAIGKIVGSGFYGTWHAVNEEPASWYDLARGVASEFGYDPEAVQPTTSDRFPRPAPRPPNSSLRNFVLEESLGIRMRPWKETLSGYAESVRRSLEESA